MCETNNVDVVKDKLNFSSIEALLKDDHYSSACRMTYLVSDGENMPDKPDIWIGSKDGNYDSRNSWFSRPWTQIYTQGGHDLLSSGQSFYVRPLMFQETNWNKDSAAPYIYTNVYEELGDNEWPSGIICGMAMPLSGQQHERNPSAVFTECELPYLPIKEETYEATAVSGIAFSYSGNDMIIYYVKQWLKDGSFKLRQFYTYSKYNDFFKGYLRPTEIGTSEIIYDSVNRKFKMIPEKQWYAPDGSFKKSYSGKGTFTWGYWETDECEIDAIENDERENVLRFHYVKNVETDLDFDDFVLIKTGRLSYTNGNTTSGHIYYYGTDHIYWPMFTASTGKTFKTTDALCTKYARIKYPENRMLITPEISTTEIYLSIDPATYTIPV